MPRLLPSIPRPRPQGGLAAMLAQHGATPDVVGAARQVEATPGASQLLYTVAAKKMITDQGIPKSKAKKLRLFNAGSGQASAPMPVMAKGGAVKEAAEKTRAAGRGNDSMLLHLAPSEYDALTEMWGAPQKNPKTGIPEYGFLSDAWDSVSGAVKKVVKSPIFQMVAPIALNAFFPGAGTAIGTALGATGDAAPIVGQAVIQGGLGAAANGKKGAVQGAISGAVMGGLGKMTGEKLGLEGKTASVVGSAVAQGLGTGMTGGDFMSGAVQGGLSAAVMPAAQEAAGNAPTSANAAASSAPPVASADPLTQLSLTDNDASPLPGLGGAGYTPTTQPGAPAVTKAGDLSKYALPAVLGLSALGSMGGSGSAKPGKPPPLPPGFNTPLKQYALNRQYSGINDPSSYFTYGQVGAPMQGQHLFFEPTTPGGLETVAQANPALGNTPRAARGGYADGGDTSGAPMPSRYVRGAGTGRSDDIDAKLSDGEYVMDAETVALLGDGSGEAGAKRLDQMRANLRKHKAQKLAKGEFSNKAKDPAAYMRGGLMQRLRQARRG